MSASRSFSVASLYVHWPYCKRRCTYCNFNKYVSKFVDHERMRRCLVRELKTVLGLSGVSSVSSVFFGGGTPSLAEPRTIESVLTAVRQTTAMAEDAEVSMEVNPTALEIDKLKEFHLAGVNRVSIGVQTLDGRGLAILGRDHSAQDSLRCLEAAKKLFPNQVSVDLIFGWPGQDVEMWQRELNHILGVCDKHISLYQLTLERGTQLFKLVQSGQAILADNGFERYEVSNFAREGCYGQHNLSYWTGRPYIGIGPGAHGRFRPGDRQLHEARVQTLEPPDWMWEVEKFGHATRKATPLSVIQQLEELLIVGLRTKWGISNQMWQSVSPETNMMEILAESMEIQQHFQNGLLELDKIGLRATSAGMNVLDSILPDLLNALDSHHTAHTSPFAQDPT
ncbi:radical S-adenosyl methionine domain-containing protein 1, mitochondrial isoform X2 [Aplysia californica]|uniref:Radical S-adenosyl methionine domain-containing protein 1, mitochondrial n=1 Tax=Aplysia californica TaxID=6500 RepID=A0ABM1VW84_APLCA|nr:radical S-adenosyl methionine domain-containing protein 1, mitochondrial isoform X2 [Aplysia californica]